MSRLPHAEVKEEPGLRPWKSVTTQVVALAVVGRALDRSTPGLHGPVCWYGELRMTFRVRRHAVLSESRMR
jgi:hypothetical protein